jgi:hypothetical protein
MKQACVYIQKLDKVRNEAHYFENNTFIEERVSTDCFDTLYKIYVLESIPGSRNIGT